MSAAKPKTKATPKTAPSHPEKPALSRGFPGNDQERADALQRFTEEHRETVRRLGK
jgi:hypothetical protein